MFENQNQLFRYLRLGFVGLAFVLGPYFVNRIPVLKSLFQDMPLPVLVFVAVMFAAIVVVGPELNVEESSSEELLRELGKKNGKLIRQRFKSSLDRNCYIPIKSVPSPDDLDSSSETVDTSAGQQNSESQSSLEPRKPIWEIFLEARGRVLILGEPGSGKTTELLKLALALGEEAARDPEKPIPVIFELSAWRGEPMLAWMEEQMVMRYSLNPDICGEWLKNDRIVPLLDGLDELGENDNGAKEAIEAIDTLLEDCGDRSSEVGYLFSD